MITVPQPKFFPQQNVLVFNYRRKSKANPQGVWERGRITKAECHVSGTQDGKRFYANWHYQVILERKTPITKTWGGREIGGNTLWLHVTSEQLSHA